ncbi:MAG: hypothetical protein KDA25_02220, partial [Phycisphaerales bacterium]|nr:hypothetical protein [Phycisphaerales bacterium]
HDADGRTVWQVGGQLAEEGVSMTPEALIARGITELRGILPGVDFADVEWATYRVDRAEPAVDGRRRPEDVVADAHGPVIVAWPTKLALAPRLADQLIDLLPPARAEAGEFDWPHRPAVARPPWEDDVTWYPAAPSAGPACT